MDDALPAETPAETTAPAEASSTLLRDCWYLVAAERDLPPGTLIHRMLCGEPLVLGRGADGVPFALLDICPHRGIPLSHGWLEGGRVVCSYHGWAFNPDGGCAAIPSLVSGQDFDLSRVKVRRYPARAVDGNIWVYMPARHPAPPDDALPPVPRVPENAGRYVLHISQVFACNVDHAVIGLMDPAHGPYVHKSVLWRSSRSAYEKAKAFSPLAAEEGLGWKMDRHTASKNSRAYRLFLGGQPETEISFRLPSVRIEHAVAKKASYCGLTVCTPIDDATTIVHHVIYADLPLVGLLKPLVRKVAHRFLGQDREAVERQQEGLRFNPPLMLIRDADTMAIWYYRLKREWLAARAENRAPRNPLRPTTLRWRS